MSRPRRRTTGTAAGAALRTMAVSLCTAALLSLAITGSARAECFTNDYTDDGTFTAPSLSENGVTVTGSADINVLDLNGLGIVGGLNDNVIDGAESMTFTFDQASLDVSYDVSAHGNGDADGDVGGHFVEVFGESGSLGTFFQDLFTDPVDVSALVGGVPVKSFSLTMDGADTIRIGTVSFCARCFTNDYTDDGTFTAPSLSENGVTVTGSADINVLDLNGLGIVGGLNDNVIDGAESMTFTFDQASLDVSYDVSAHGNGDADGDVGGHFVEVFGESGSLGTFFQDLFTDPVDVSALVGGVPVKSFTLTMDGADTIRIGTVSFCARCFTNDYTDDGTFTAPSLSENGVTVTGSADVNVFFGLGIVGGVLDERVDTTESITFTFDQLAVDVLYFVNISGNDDADGDSGDRSVEVFDDGGSLGTFDADGPGSFDVSALVGDVPIRSFTITMDGDSIRIGNLSFCTPVASACGNDVLDGDEECDGTDDGACPGFCVPPGLPNECACALHHFQCYEAGRQPFEKEPVLLEDLFSPDPSGPELVTRKRIKRFCLPADKNGENPAAPLDPAHLTGYQITQRPRPPKVLDVPITDQFGTRVVDVTRPTLLLVPSAKDLLVPPAPLAPADLIDHFKCYRLRKWGKGRQEGLAVVDQFGSITVDLKRAFELCVPVDKNGEGILDPSVFLTCYKAKTDPRRPANKRIPFFVSNQFGDLVLEVTRMREFCLPSRVGGVATPTPIGTPTPTATPTITPTPTPTSTPPPCGGAGSKCVFVTQDTFQGQLAGGGLGGADGLCQLAGDNGLAFLAGKTWMAWLSDSNVGPATRFITQAAVPYLRPDAVQVAANWADLTDGTLDVPIEVTETGGAPSPFSAVWTNTLSDGTPDNSAADPSADSCDDWTNAGAPFGRTGLHGATNDSWTGVPGVQRACTSSAGHHLYCFEQ